MKQTFFLLILVFTLTACWDKTDDQLNGISIRLENLTGVDLEKVHLGRRIEKVSGYSYVEFKNEFKTLDNNELTDFFETQGKFNGYDSVVGRLIDDSSNITWQDPEKEEAFIDAGAFEDSWTNPFTENDRTGLSLVEGDYTFQLSLSDDGDNFLVEIIKE